LLCRPLSPPCPRPLRLSLALVANMLLLPFASLALTHRRAPPVPRWTTRATTCPTPWRTSPRTPQSTRAKVRDTGAQLACREQVCSRAASALSLSLSLFLSPRFPRGCRRRLRLQRPLLDTCLGFDPAPLERAAEKAKVPKAKLWEELKGERGTQAKFKGEAAEARTEARGLAGQASPSRPEKQRGTGAGENNLQCVRCSSVRHLGSSYPLPLLRAHARTAVPRNYGVGSVARRTDHLSRTSQAPVLAVCRSWGCCLCGR
jgi:hypothetical protein